MSSNEIDAHFSSVMQPLGLVAQEASSVAGGLGSVFGGMAQNLMSGANRYAADVGHEASGAPNLAGLPTPDMLTSDDSNHGTIVHTIPIALPRSDYRQLSRGDLLFIKPGTPARSSARGAQYNHLFSRAKVGEYDKLSAPIQGRNIAQVNYDLFQHQVAMLKEHNKPAGNGIFYEDVLNDIEGLADRWIPWGVWAHDIDAIRGGDAEAASIGLDSMRDYSNRRGDDIRNVAARHQGKEFVYNMWGANLQQGVRLYLVFKPTLVSLDEFFSFGVDPGAPRTYYGEMQDSQRTKTGHRRTAMTLAHASRATLNSGERDRVIPASLEHKDTYVVYQWIPLASLDPLREPDIFYTYSSDQVTLFGEPVGVTLHDVTVRKVGIRMIGRVKNNTKPVSVPSVAPYLLSRDYTMLRHQELVQVYLCQSRCLVRLG